MVGQGSAATTVIKHLDDDNITASWTMKRAKSFRDIISQKNFTDSAVILGSAEAADLNADVPPSDRLLSGELEKRVLSHDG
jgi:malonyl CoA-acyl carrier protein transacylase